jgi:hypothetical protein
MRLPGFTAEKTVYEPTTQYRREGSYKTVGQGVQPAGLNWACYAACLTGCGWGGVPQSLCRQSCRRQCTTTVEPR